MKSASRRPTKHRLTRLGWQFMLIGMFGILGGSLNGLNLLIVVAAITMGVLFAQWRVSRGFIENARIERRMPVEIFAGKTVRVRYQVSNRNRLRPMWLLRVSDEMKRAGSPTIALRSAVGLLSPRQTTSAFADLTAPQRGRYQLSRWHLETVAPFGLSTAWSDGTVEGKPVDVYPRLLPLARSWRHFLPTRIGNVAANAQRRGPSDEVFFGLREYRRGDSPRHIHWRTTARIGEPAVRQYEQQRRYDLCLLLDPFQAAEPAVGRRKKVDRVADEATELAISLAATLAVELVGGAGDTVMAIVQPKPIAVGGGATTEGLRRMLTQLAAVVPHDNGPLHRTLALAAQVARHPPDLLIISTRDQSEATQASPEASDVLRRWQRQSRVVWLNVHSRELQRWTTATLSGDPPADKPIGDSSNRATPSPSAV